MGPRRQIEDVGPGTPGYKPEMAASDPVRRKFSYQSAPAGSLVTRSAHWYTQHSDGRDQIGIVTDHTTYEESGALITYPWIHWAGESAPSLTHPLNADLYSHRGLLASLRELALSLEHGHYPAQREAGANLRSRLPGVSRS